MKLYSCSNFIKIRMTGLRNFTRAAGKKLRAYGDLSKIKLSLMNGCSPIVGYLAVAPTFDPLLALALFGGNTLMAMCSQSSGQLIEKNEDAIMNRTKARPLPMHLISPAAALVFSGALFASSNLLLFSSVHWSSAVLTNLTFFGYLYYLRLKKQTKWNTAFGAIVGSMPLLVGNLAASSVSAVDLGAILDFAYLTFWQFVHFYTIVWKYGAEYREAGFKMVDEPRAIAAIMLASLLVMCVIIHLKSKEKDYSVVSSVLLLLTHLAFALCVVRCFRGTLKMRYLFLNIYKLFFFFFAMMPTCEYLLKHAKSQRHEHR